MQSKKNDPRKSEERDKLCRAYFRYITHPSDDTANEMAQACLAILDRRVGFYVHAKGIHPSFLAPATFAKDAFSRAMEKFWAGLHRVRNPEQLIAWLNTIAHSAVVEELLTWIRRTQEGPVHWDAIEQEVPGDGD